MPHILHSRANAKACENAELTLVNIAVNMSSGKVLHGLVFNLNSDTIENLPVCEPPHYEVL